MFGYIIVTLGLIQTVLGRDLSQCHVPLGMQRGAIPDEALSASSWKDEGTKPSNARIRLELGQGAWCPSQLISKDVYEWLQVDLGQLMVITLVETQGRFGNGQGQEFVEQYKLQYQREFQGTWFTFRDRHNREVFQGNTNTYIAELREVIPPIIARRIRFVPYSSRPLAVCLRVELFGCAWTDGVVAYKMRQGERRRPDINLYDLTYDGKEKNDMLSGGLGQLMDGEQGQINFRFDSKGQRSKGYEWIGWRNDTFRNLPLEIIFRFDELRNFTVLKIHCHNLFSKDIRVFKKAMIYFSVGGRGFRDPPIVFWYLRDVLLEFARPVNIDLQHRIGRYAKVQLFFDSKWMLLSEVEFESEPAQGIFLPELPASFISKPSTSTTTYTTLLPSSTAIAAKTTRRVPFGKPHKASTGLGKSRTAVPVQPKQNLTDSFHPSRTKGTLQDTQLTSNLTRSLIWDTLPMPEGSDADFITSPRPSFSPTKHRKPLNESIIGIIIGVLSALTILLFVIMLIMILHHRKRKRRKEQRQIKLLQSDNATYDLSEMRVTLGKVSNGSVYNCVALSDVEPEVEQAGCVETDAHSAKKWTDEGVSSHGCLTNSLTTFQPEQAPYCIESKRAQTMKLQSTRTKQGHLNDASFVCNNPDSAYSSTAESHQLNISDLRAASPAPRMGTACPYTSLPNTKCGKLVAKPSPLSVTGVQEEAPVGNDGKCDLSLEEIPCESLELLEKFGQGWFGEIHLCKLNKPDVGHGLDTKSTTLKPGLVILKLLSANADQALRSSFLREVGMMSELKDANLVQVLGISCIGGQPAVILEYTKYGDLNQFLQRHSLEDTNLHKEPNMKPLSQNCLVHMAMQVASGMRYLESLNMVHRDLAARNCLVGHKFSIKISDLGTSRELYAVDYYNIEGQGRLPLRWMAWESVFLGKFTTRSDIWSFGVTLWQILTLARERPFSQLSDEHVIENCSHYYCDNGRHVYLPPPSNCPKDIYVLMKECWNREEGPRPSFREIHLFLQRKTIGYSPRLEKRRNSRKEYSLY